MGALDGALRVAPPERLRPRRFNSLGAGTPDADLLPPKSASRRECPRQNLSRLLPYSGIDLVPRVTTERRIDEGTQRFRHLLDLTESSIVRHACGGRMAGSIKGMARSWRA